MEDKEFEINLKNIFLAGVGAVAESIDKSKEVFGELVEKGEKGVEKGKVVNEELKHKIEDKIKENVEIKVVKDELNNSEDILNAVKNLSSEELATLSKKIAEMSGEKGSEEKGNEETDK